MEVAALALNTSAADTVERTSTMPIEKLPDQTTLNKLLRYDADTGKLFWRERTPELFVSGPTPNNARTSWNKRCAGKEAFTIHDRDGYHRASLMDRPRLAHRVIWKMVYGTEPPMIDHINRVRDDNRICNLRESNPTSNSRNRIYKRRADASIYPYDNGTKWRVYRFAGGETRYSGNHLTIESARAARDAIDHQYARPTQEEAAATLQKVGG